jgi:hypothetical protein
MNSYLYHKDIFMPNSVKSPMHVGRLSYTFHAFTAAQNDRYGQITLPLVFNGQGEVIEVEAIGQNPNQPIKIAKQVWRVNYDDKNDLIIVMVDGGRVKTVWLNSKADKHRTLDRTKYVTKY